MRVLHVCVALLALGATACEGTGTGMFGVNTEPGVGTGTSNNPLLASVQVTNNAFAPVTVRIRPLGTVTWVWAADATLHNVTFADGALNSATQSSGIHSLTFPTAGTYDYHCTVHAGMTGSVVVD